MDITLKILFIILSYVKINLINWKLYSKLYITIEAFSTIKWIKLIETKEFETIAHNSDNEIFVVHIASLASFVLNIYSSYRAQLALLI